MADLLSLHRTPNGYTLGHNHHSEQGWRDGYDVKVGSIYSPRSTGQGWRDGYDVKVGSMYTSKSSGQNHQPVLARNLTSYPSVYERNGISVARVPPLYIQNANGSRFVTQTPSRSVTPSPSRFVTTSPPGFVTPTSSRSVTPTPSRSVTPTPSRFVNTTPSGFVTPTPSRSVTPTSSRFVTPSPPLHNGRIPTNASDEMRQDVFRWNNVHKRCTGVCCTGSQPLPKPRNEDRLTFIEDYTIINRNQYGYVPLNDMILKEIGIAIDECLSYKCAFPVPMYEPISPVSYTTPDHVHQDTVYY